MESEADKTELRRGKCNFRPFFFPKTSQSINLKWSEILPMPTKDTVIVRTGNLQCVCSELCFFYILLQNCEIFR